MVAHWLVLKSRLTQRRRRKMMRVAAVAADVMKRLQEMGQRKMKMMKMTRPV